MIVRLSCRVMGSIDEMNEEQKVCGKLIIITVILLPENRKVPSSDQARGWYLLERDKVCKQLYSLWRQYWQGTRCVLLGSHTKWLPLPNSSSSGVTAASSILAGQGI
jgi:hypothetical protein